MEPLTANDLPLSPDRVAILHTRARRAQAQALYNGVLWLAAAIRERLVARRTPRLPFGTHWG